MASASGSDARVTEDMVKALLALGSNLGDRTAHLNHAVARIATLPETRIAGLSTLYETAPVGGPDDQGPYLNGVVAVESSLGSHQLLRRLHQIEGERERERQIRWGARTLDLDLLTYGDETSDDPSLELPHPRMHTRRFVMVPVCDVAADRVHPRLGRTMAELLDALPDEPGDLVEFDRNWGAKVPLIRSNHL